MQSEKRRIGEELCLEGIVGEKRVEYDRIRFYHIIIDILILILVEIEKIEDKLEIHELIYSLNYQEQQIHTLINLIDIVILNDLLQ